MELSQYGELFLSEAREHLSAINHLLLELEAGRGAAAAVEGLFRSVHTIKGMSATMGYAGVAALAHELEEVLDRLRSSGGEVDPGTPDLLFAAADALEHSIDAAVAEAAEPGEVRRVVQRLRSFAGSEGPIDALVGDTIAEPGEAVLAVEVEVSAESALPGVRAFLVLKRARELGEVSGVSPDEARFGDAAFAGHLRFLLRTEEPEAAVREALVGVGDVAAVVVGELGAAAAPDSGRSDEARRSGARNIRVDLRRLDALMNGVGELVILRDRLQRLAASQQPELRDTLDQAGRLISELQHEVVQSRLVPVWQVFDRFPRLVRDAARQLGKRVELVIEGKETQLDRSVLDEIGDPLVHLLRNAVDHGFETPAERRAAGKSETGTLRLGAARERSHVALRVEDDGRGIDRKQVLARALSRGLVEPAAAADLSGEEVFRLLLLAGFSTADEVTDVSGRGVGLDVVATRVRALGGLLEIRSREGAGTTFILRLPLSLAIVRALLVRVADEAFALPLTHVLESVELEPGQVGLHDGRRVATIRDEVYPLVDLGELLGRPGHAFDTPRPTVIVEAAGAPLAVGVDELAGQQEVVVKSFDATQCTLRLFSGATILADGRPALILDVGSLAALAVGDAAAEGATPL
ncbi:MAG: chemotaxis protein CheW [Longimicrobiaceae bacterium]